MGQEEEDDSTRSTEMSICKSSPLFSPMREPHLPGKGTFSVDSLDADDTSLTITCQANKYNYTIAFEGSFTDTSNNDSQSRASGNQRHQVQKEIDFNMVSFESKTYLCF